MVEEGPRYKFGTVEVESELRDFDARDRSSRWSDQAGRLVQRQAGRRHGHRPERDRRRLRLRLRRRRARTTTATPKTLTMDVTFQVGETPRVYVERIDINGNTVTHDKVIRREFRLNEGDAFNALQVKRSPGPHPVARLLPGESRDQADRRARRPTGSSSASTSRRRRPASCSCRPASRASRSFIVSALDRAAQLPGQGPGAAAPASTIRAIRKSIELGFTEPYLFDKNILLGGDIFRRDYNSFNYRSATSATRPISQSRTGGGSALGVPVTEYRELRHALLARSTTRSRSTRALSYDRSATATGRCRPDVRSAARPAAICATSSASA